MFQKAVYSNSYHPTALNLQVFFKYKTSRQQSFYFLSHNLVTKTEYGFCGKIGSPCLACVEIIGGVEI